MVGVPCPVGDGPGGARARGGEHHGTSSARGDLRARPAPGPGGGERGRAGRGQEHGSASLSALDAGVLRR